MITPSWLPPASYSAYTIGDECCRRFGLWSRGSMNIAGCKWLSHRWSRIDTVDCDVGGKAEAWEREREKGDERGTKVSILNGWWSWKKDRRLPLSLPPPPPPPPLQWEKQRREEKRQDDEGIHRRAISATSNDRKWGPRFRREGCGRHQGWFAV